MKENLEKISDGRVELKIYPSAELGDEQDMMEQLKIGSLDILSSSYPNVARYFPKFAFFSVSYLFESYDHLNRFLQDPEVLAKTKKILEERNEGVLLLGTSSGGARYHFNNLRPVLDISDMKGIKIRVMTNPIESRIWKAFGAMPDPMPYSEVYNALQTGVIDGGENSLTAMYNSNFYEVAPYINLTQHQFALAGLFMSEKSYNDLPEYVQKMVDESARIAVTEGLEFTKDNEIQFMLKLLNKPGVVMTAVDKTGFIKAVEPIQEEVVQELDVMEIYELIKKHR